MNEHLIRLLNGLTEVRQAFVLTMPEMEVLAAQGPDETPSSQATLLIRRCYQEKGRVLVLDSAMDSSLGRAKLPFRSALCVLLPGGKRVLYLDAEKPGHFDLRAAEKIESYVQKSRRWAVKKAEPAQGPQLPALNLPRLPLRPVIASLAVLAAVGLLLWTLVSQPSGEPQAEQKSAGKKSARAAADQLLSLLRTKQLDYAYNELAPEMTLTRDAFKRAVLDWCDSEKNRWELHNRVTQSETDGKVLITGPPGAPDWHWTFQWDGSSWKLKQADGGPFN